jgi:recombination protein RecT
VTLDQFKTNLLKYESVITDLLGNKYGITPKEFMAKTEIAVNKTPELLKCTPSSLFGSILYFAEIGLNFNSHEGFGYILSDTHGKELYANPIIGYKGLIEVAYRTDRIKTLRIQAVHEKDKFSYEYGTKDFLKHKPATTNRGKLVAVYCYAKLKDLEPMFVVVHKEQLDEVQKKSKSYKNQFSPFDTNLDIFNIMQCKIAVKLLFKTLPKQDNAILVKALELDNKFDYDKDVVINATESGYEVIEKEKKSSVMEVKNIQPIEVKVSDALKIKQGKLL